MASIELRKMESIEQIMTCGSLIEEYKYKFDEAEVIEALRSFLSDEEYQNECTIDGKPDDEFWIDIDECFWDLECEVNYRGPEDVRDWYYRILEKWENLPEYNPDLVEQHFEENLQQKRHW